MYIYWARLDPNVFQFASNWSRIGSNWVPSGLHLDPRGSHWPLLEPHWEPGPVWEPRELSSAMPAHKICVLGTRDGIRGIRRSGGRTRGSDPHPTRAGGQDDGSYTNSLKLEYVGWVGILGYGGRWGNSPILVYGEGVGMLG